MFSHCQPVEGRHGDEAAESRAIKRSQIASARNVGSLVLNATGNDTSANEASTQNYQQVQIEHNCGENRHCPCRYRRECVSGSLTPSRSVCKNSEPCRTQQQLTLHRTRQRFITRKTQKPNGFPFFSGCPLYLFVSLVASLWAPSSR